jgi:MFS family permease
VRIEEQPEAEDDRSFLTFKEGLRHPRFYHITAMLFLGIFYGIYMAAVYKKTAQDFLDDDTLTLAGAIGSVCNGCSRYLWASLQDVYGFRRVYSVVMVIQLVISATIWNVRANPYLYPLWVALSFLCEGAHFSQYPALSSKVFGVQYAGEIFTIIFMVIPASSALSYLLVQFGKDSIPPRTIFWIAAAFSLANLILTYFLDETPIRGGGKKGDGAKNNKNDDNSGRI